MRAVTGSGGRLHLGMVAGIKSESLAGLPRNSQAKLIALACSPAPEGFARWSLRLLEEKVVELNIVEKASDNTIGRTLKKTLSNRTAIGNG